MTKLCFQFKFQKLNWKESLYWILPVRAVPFFERFIDIVGHIFSEFSVFHHFPYDVSIFHSVLISCIRPIMWRSSRAQVFPLWGMHRAFQITQRKDADLRKCVTGHGLSWTCSDWIFFLHLRVWAGEAPIPRKDADIRKSVVVRVFCLERIRILSICVCVYGK